jgi:hypothetical protein
MSVATKREVEEMEMKEQAERFRRQVLERGGVGPRTRYTAEQRQEAVEYVRARQPSRGRQGRLHAVSAPPSSAPPTSPVWRCPEPAG